MKIAIGADHGGYALKLDLMEYVRSLGHKVVDMGTHSKESSDYPLIGFEVAHAVSVGDADRGILICKSGVGMVIIANKLNGVRAAACYDTELAKSSREHNDTNVMVLGANYSTPEQARNIANVWLSTPHLGERHARRVTQINEIEIKIKGNGTDDQSKKM
jgi:ribose 5-phosphate isomerase B